MPRWTSRKKVFAAVSIATAWAASYLYFLYQYSAHEITLLILLIYTSLMISATLTFAVYFWIMGRGVDAWLEYRRRIFRLFFVPLFALVFGFIWRGLEYATNLSISANVDLATLFTAFVLGGLFGAYAGKIIINLAGLDF